LLVLDETQRTNQGAATLKDQEAHNVSVFTHDLSMAAEVAKALSALVSAAVTMAVASRAVRKAANGRHRSGSTGTSDSE
jgi:hypothetical protein